MKSILINTLIGFFIIFFSKGYAEDLFDITFSSRVFDNAKILNENDLTRLNSILEKIEEETTNQILIAIINTLEGKSIEDFSLEIFNSIGIGQRIKNNGILILLAMEERSIRISIGYGLENVITDSYASFIITNIVVPHFKNSDFKSGIFNAVDVIKEQLYKPDIKHYFSMKWDIENFKEFLTKYPQSIQKCDAYMFLGRFYEDKWNNSLIRFLNNDYREESIKYYKKYLSDCENGIWKVIVKNELARVENKEPDSINYLED